MLSFSKPVYLASVVQRYDHQQCVVGLADTAVWKDTLKNCPVLNALYSMDLRKKAIKTKTGLLG